MEFVHAGSFEGNSSVEHCEQNHACAPQVDIQAIASASQKLRSYVSRRTALLVHYCPWLCLFGYTEVSDLHVSNSV